MRFHVWGFVALMRACHNFGMLSLEAMMPRRIEAQTILTTTSVLLLSVVLECPRLFLLLHCYVLPKQTRRRLLKLPRILLLLLLLPVALLLLVLFLLLLSRLHFLLLPLVPFLLSRTVAMQATSVTPAVAIYGDSANFRPGHCHCHHVDKSPHFLAYQTW